MGDPAVRRNHIRAAGAKHAQWVRDAVARYERPLTRYAAHITGDPERARDVVQDVFLRLCDERLETIGSHLAEWLYTVTRNLAIDIRRKEKRMRRMSDEQADSFVAGDAAPSELMEVEDAMSNVLEAMVGLLANQQECIRLKFQHGLTDLQHAAIERQLEPKSRDVHASIPTRPIRRNWAFWGSLAASIAIVCTVMAGVATKLYRLGSAGQVTSSKRRPAPGTFPTGSCASALGRRMRGRPQGPVRRHQ